MARIASLIAATLVVATSLIAFEGAAAAHERRTVGPYQLVVGFLAEPAFAGESNGLDLRVSDTRVTPAKAVEGLEKTLTIDVQAGGLTPLPLALTARFGTPGAYNGYFVPTAKGTYIFHVRGKIESLDIDEKFESGPGRFNDVESTTDLQYPTKVPTADDLTRRLSDLQGAVDQTRILALAAVLLGILAFGAA
ncbi:MAG TPA: hypothetical protein VGQ86_01240, partial [Candidatus Limnocylindria bacterium]|nr:hypothetical protein [Candidatus Limnocylindria bacterium]